MISGYFALPLVACELTSKFQWDRLAHVETCRHFKCRNSVVLWLDYLSKACWEVADGFLILMEKVLQPRMSIQTRCPTNCKCTKCRYAEAKLRRPSEDHLRDVVERITLNQRRRASSPIDFVPPIHQCPCGLTFATVFHLKAHVRNVHQGKVPDSPSYLESIPFSNDGSPRTCVPHNPIGAMTGLPGELVTGNGGKHSYGVAASASNSSEYQMRAEGAETVVTSNPQEPAVKYCHKEDSVPKRKAPMSKSASKLLSANSKPVISMMKKVDMQSTVSFRCSQCLKLFPTQENLDIHFVRWHGIAPPVYPCSYSLCKSEFHTLSARNTHIKTVHEANDAFEFDRLVQWHNLGNRKSSQAAAKSDRNESQRATSTDCNKNFESNDMIGMPSVDNLAQDCPLVKSENHSASRESFGCGEFGDSSSTVETDPLNSTDTTNPLRSSIANKINWIFNAKVAYANSDNAMDPIATPMIKNAAKSTVVGTQSNYGNVKKQAYKPRILRKPTNTEPVQDISSKSGDGLQDPLPIFLDVREIAMVTVHREPRNQNVVASSASGSAKKPSNISVKSKSEVNPKVQKSNLTNVKHSTAVTNVHTLKTTEPLNVKTTHTDNAKHSAVVTNVHTLKTTEPSIVKTTHADNAKSQIKTAFASGSNQKKNAPKTWQGSQGSRNSQPGNPANTMGPTRVDYDIQQSGHLLRPRQHGVVAVIEKPQTPPRGMQTVRYIDIEGNLASMMTEVDNPSLRALYLCNICDAWFPGNTELVEHREENHVPKGTVKCKRCDKMFLTENLANCHEQFAHINEIHNEILAKAAERRATLFAKFWEATKRRAKRENREPWKEGEIIWEATNENRGHYLCLICDKNFNVKLLLHQHNITVHNKADFMCDLCGKLLGTLKGFEHHRLSCMQPPPKMISCHICNKQLSDSKKMAAHLARSHSNIRKFECDVCKKRFNEFYNLQFHIKTQHNGERKYHTCPKCQKVFTALNSVRLHDIAAHQAYDCDFCDATVIGKAELRDHVTANHRKASTNKFVCGTCQKRFITKSALVAHISLQHGIGDKVVKPKKPAPSKELIFCDVCGKAYVIKASMVRHMSVKHGFVESYFVGEKKKKTARKRKSGPSGKKSADKKAKKAKLSALDSCVDSGSMSADVSMGSATSPTISDVAFQNSFEVGNVVVQGTVVESINSDINQGGDAGENLPAVTQEIAKLSALDSAPIDIGASFDNGNLEPFPIQGTSDEAFENIAAENAVAESCHTLNEGVISQVITQEIGELSALDPVPIDIGVSNADMSLGPAMIQGTSDVAFQITDVENVVVGSCNSEANQTQNDSVVSNNITQEKAKPVALDSDPIDLGASSADANLETFLIPGTSGTAFQNTNGDNEVVGSCNSETNQAENEGVISPAEGPDEVPKVMRRSVRERKSASNFIDESNTDFMVRMIDMMCKKKE